MISSGTERRSFCTLTSSVDQPLGRGIRRSGVRIPPSPPNARGGAIAPGALHLPGLQLIAQLTVTAPIASATSLRQIYELAKDTELQLDGQAQR